MDYRSLHPWDVSPSEAVAIQRSLRSQLILDHAPEEVEKIAGVDVSYTRGSNRLYAAVVLLDLSQSVSDRKASFPIIETAVASLEVDFSYIPGLLSFREIPVILKAWERLKRRPDCLVCDGQGVAHPRRMGLAAHLGLTVDLPAVGCGKTRLIGEYREPGPDRGDFSPLVDRNEVVGAVLRTRAGVKSVFISEGHRMTLRRALEIILVSQTRYRLPEPIRMAHRLVNEARRSGSA